MMDGHPQSVYESVLRRLDRLWTVRNKVFRNQLEQVLALTNYLLEESYCERHFISTLQTVLSTEAEKHAQSSVSREALEVCLTAVRLAADDVKAVQR